MNNEIARIQPQTNIKTSPLPGHGQVSLQSLPTNLVPSKASSSIKKTSFRERNQKERSKNQFQMIQLKIQMPSVVAEN